MSTTVLVISALLVVIFIYIFLTQRKFVALEEKMKNAFSQINVQMKSRISSSPQKNFFLSALDKK